MRIIILIVAILVPFTVYAQPSIKFDSEVFDFEEVRQGKQLEHTFQFVNSGTEDLLIERLVPS